MVNKDLIKLYVENCNFPIGELQFSELSSYLKAIYINRRMFIIQNTDFILNGIEQESLNIKDYEYKYLTPTQKKIHIDKVGYILGLSTLQYMTCSDKLKIYYIEKYHKLEKSKVNISSYNVLYKYVDILHKGNGDSMEDILKNVKQPELIIQYLNKQGYTHKFENQIHNCVTSMFINTSKPLKLVTETDKLLYTSGWYDKSWKEEENSLISWLTKDDIKNILTKTFYPEKIFKLLKTDQKETYLNYTNQHPINFLSMISDSKNPSSLLNIFGLTAIDIINKFLSRDENLWSEDKKLYIMENLLSKLYDFSRPTPVSLSPPNDANFAINPKITKQLYISLCNCDMAYKFIKFIKNSNIKVFDKYMDTDDRTETAKDMGELGF